MPVSPPPGQLALWSHLPSVLKLEIEAVLETHRHLHTEILKSVIQITRGKMQNKIANSQMILCFVTKLF